MRRYERGAMPDLKTAVQLAAVYGATVEAVFRSLIRRARKQIETKLKRLPGRDRPKIPTFRGRTKPILALDPWTRGMGTAIMVGEQLLRCHVRYLKGSLSERLQVRGKAFVEDLIRTFKPKVLVLPKTDYPQSRRSPHVRLFCDTIKNLALRTNLKVVEYQREETQRRLDVSGRFNRHRIAVAVAKRFPELASKLPPPRKFYKPQDVRVSAFYAVALAWVAIEKKYLRRVRK